MLKIEFFDRKRLNIYLFLVIVFFVSFIWSYALSSIMYGVLFLFFILDPQNLVAKFRSLATNKIVLLFILLFTANLTSVAYSDNFNTGLKNVIDLVPILFLPALCLSENLSLKDNKNILRAIKFIVLLTFVFLLVSHLFIESRPLGTFVQYAIDRKLGLSQFYISFLLFLSILQCFYEIHKNKKYHNILFVLFLFFCVIILNNKTSFVFSIVLVFFGLHKIIKKYSFKVRMIVMVLIGLGILIFTINTTTAFKIKYENFVKTTDFNIETIKTKNSVTYTQNTFEHRLLIWHISIKEISASFPLGVGTGDYMEILFENYKAINFKTGIKLKLNCHNQYITEFLKTGFIGGICFIVLLFFLAKEASMSDYYYIYLISFFIIGCFFESYIERQHGVIIFSFIIPFILKYETLLKLDNHE